MDNKTIAMEDIFEDWGNDERMGALFNEFRPKHVNPEGWTSKMNVWSSAINSWCRKTKTINLTLSDLRCAFERKGLYPQCLQPVLQQMFREGTFSNSGNANNSSEGQSWINWGVNVFVTKPVSWGWSTINDYIYGKTEDCSTQKFIHMPLLKEMSSSLLEQLKPRVEFETRSISLKECQKIYNEMGAQAESLNLVLKYLQNQKSILIFTETGTQYVKLCNELKEKDIVTDKDVGLLRLQKTFDKVQEEIENLQTDMQSCTDQAKAALKTGQRSKAQLLLRRRKYLEKAAEQKIRTSDQLEVMIDKLKNSSTDQQVIGALNAGLRAQKAIVNKGAGIDDVENTMADIQDAFDEQEEISQAMSRPVTTNYSLEDSALEEELEELLSLQNLKDKEKEEEEPLSPAGFSLPNVPKGSPTAEVPSKTALVPDI